jgi:hypothetical protein
MPITASDFGDEDVEPTSFAFAAEIPVSVAGAMAVDKLITQLFGLCWALLPKERKTFEAFEKEIHRLVDRALRDLKDDCDSFHIGK